MLSAQRVEAAGSRGYERGAFESVPVGLSGRLMLPDFEEYDCDVAEMSPGDMSVRCVARAKQGDRIIAYIKLIGRIEGHVLAVSGDGFTMSVTATDRKREKLAAQLTWIANKQPEGQPQDRRHARVETRDSGSRLLLEDGTSMPCRIIDLSLSGAAIEIASRPRLGAAVRLGDLPGRVVRHFQEGVAIEFDHVQSSEILGEMV
jgi:hypothetical protein